MYDMDQIILMARQEEASDVHISAGLPLVFRVHGVLIPALAQPDEESAEVMIRGLLNERQLKVLEEGRDLTFHCRHRTETVRGSTCSGQQGNSPRRSVWLNNSSIPTLEQPHLSKNYMNWRRNREG